MTPQRLFLQSSAATFDERAIKPARELGAYEYLWSQTGTTFKTMADLFRANPGAVPSDFVPPHETEHYTRLTLSTIREAGIKHFGVRVHGAGEYPEKLRDAKHPVELLYFQGDWGLTSLRSVAVVGTRKPSEEGRRRASKLARLLVRDGFCIVSGLAEGIDSAAHTAAIEEDGKTVAVIGTPITECYPRVNADLQRRLADEFLVISQVPIIRYSRQGPKWNKLFFPERNVTMAALTEATVIVEAGNTSGTLIQARNALQQKRKVFILDSCFKNPSLAWPHRYAELGAIRIRDFEEIRDHLAP